MDEDDVEEELKKSKETAQQAELDRQVAKEAASNVDELRELKKALKAEGKSAVEIKKAVKELKEKHDLKRGRPAADAVVNPVKNPVTGEFEPANE